MNKKEMKKQYAKNKSAKVNDKCICPSCGTHFVKTNYQQAFCKTNSGTICKDKYWNTVDEIKRNNTTRISPASHSFMNTPQRIADREDRLINELEQDGGWESHQCYVERCHWCGYINCRCED